MKALSLEPENINLFQEGRHYHCYGLFGAHLVAKDGIPGIQFTLWAPHAAAVYLIGEFNDWQGSLHPFSLVDPSGIWSLFFPNLKEEALYKYEIHTSQGKILHKADPYSFFGETRPGTASKVFNLQKYQWHDEEWLSLRSRNSLYNAPINIYEVHLGSWKRKDNGDFYTYRELAPLLISYVVEMGYTHIELLPLTEHPFDGSWGYQSTGYFAVTSRYGTPEDFMYFVDSCHQKGIGIILDWVPGHFCSDAHGLANFDGTPLYEYQDPQRAINHQWGTRNFDFTKPQVWSFLISNALFWLDIYHLDGLRVDAVAFMLYLDYGKSSDQWTPNCHGGRENLEAIAFMKRLNETICHKYPNVLVFAEESTAWPLVTKPTYLGGLGYSYKWNMGWMNDMLRYMEMDPIHRKWHHELVTFSFMYAFSENFVLPLSHDEVVHGKKSLLNKMPGDYWQKFANLRAFYGYMMAHPGKKLLFMGGEFGQFIEWRDDQGLDWLLLDYDMHHKLHEYVRFLNHFYSAERLLWEIDHDWDGFQWIDPHDSQQSIITFMRKSINPEYFMIILCNFTPVVREAYRIGVPQLGEYMEAFNSDLSIFGGSHQVNNTPLMADAIPWHNQPYSLTVKVPPLATIYIKPKIRKLRTSKKKRNLLRR
ncbi:1,4-alpha-glucan branching enzyme [Anaerosolibacter carboniphilus]|uniref:1,4-alpha-glucan branching enzyme GlgB n=2 Tax=Anaerosolibacter carboniphilus TaxID=1417629 RepID=A0A841KR14_9FIRM|nr:1,4-alpha-glucan branching enzyme [Anaerosolibacter carboniphilus]